jgi:DNA-binding NarL/FixJ family response regulator
MTRRLVRQFMARPRPGETAPGIAELSDRERQVFEHLAAGLSNVDIARAMFVSEATVKTHINRLFAKLGVRDRVQAVIYAYESGFVAPGARSEH